MGEYIFDTTDEAECALPNGTRVLHVKRDRPGVVTGSQWYNGRFIYNVTWEDKRALPMFVEGEKLRAAQ
jgi:hypothetical protein